MKGGTFGRNLSVTGGRGDDSITLDTETVNDNLDVKGGQGNDQFTLIGNTVTKLARINGGQGNDSILAETGDSFGKSKREGIEVEPPGP